MKMEKKNPNQLRRFRNTFIFLSKLPLPQGPEALSNLLRKGKLRKTMRFYFHFGIACLSFVFFFPFRGKRLEGEGMFGRASRPGMMSAAFRAAAWKRLSDRYAKDSPQLPSTHHQLWTTLDIAFFQRLAIKRPWKNEMMSKVPVQSCLRLVCVF